jgi:hypothetical protein
LELADRGTLFLDEIGEMPLGRSGKALRVFWKRARIIPNGGGSTLTWMFASLLRNRELNPGVARQVSPGPVTG